MPGSEDATLATGSAGRSLRGVAAPEPLARGSSVGRYVVIGQLGAGAMGIVYDGYDPDLERTVALKVLHPEVHDRDSERLLREAQAIARLNHPNIVGVHDVGRHEGRVYLAMELVRGETLKEWNAKPRGWREVVDVMVAAGRGLAAAHAADLVHRDFKPDNVMVGSDGRVRVTDFGLALTQSVASSRSMDDPLTTVDGVEVTRAQAGTPAYMAPEQHAEMPLGPAADQFAFGVVLWELLYGERPFGGDSIASIAADVLDGKRKPAPSNASVPRWLRNVGARALALEPRDRFPSMEALLAAIDKGRRRTKNRVGVVALAGVGVGVLGWQGFERMRGEELRRDCEAVGAEIAQTWNEETSTAIRSSFVASGSPIAESMHDRLVPEVDRYADSWRESRTVACLAARQSTEWSDELVLRSRWCFDERRLELEALVERLTEGSKADVHGALPSLTMLGATEACADASTLERAVRPPAELENEVRETRRALAVATLGRSMAELAAAAPAIERLLARARELGWAPLVATTQLELGRSRSAAGDYPDAALVMQDAYFVALEVGADEVAYRAARNLSTLTGARMADKQNGLAWVRHAEQVARRLPDPLQLRAASLIKARASILAEHSEVAEALELDRQAEQMLTQALGADSLRAVAGRYQVADRLSLLGRLDEARAIHTGVMEARVRVLGETHPAVVESIAALAVLAARSGDMDEAVRRFERVVGIRRALYGPDHPLTLATMSNLGNAHLQRGDIDEARRIHESVLERRRKRSEPVDLARTLANLGHVDMKAGNPEAARDRYEEAIELGEWALGPTHIIVANTTTNLGTALFELGDYARAAELHRTAANALTAAVGPEHSYTVKALNGLEEAIQALETEADALSEPDPAP